MGVPNIDRLTANDKDFSTALEMTIRESLKSPSLPVTSHQALLIPHPCFQTFGNALSHIVIPSAAEGSFLHCGQYHIGIGRETTPWCYVFLLSHIYRLSICKKDFSLALEMTIRESDFSQSPSLLVPSHSRLLIPSYQPLVPILSHPLHAARKGLPSPLQSLPCLGRRRAFLSRRKYTSTRYLPVRQAHRSTRGAGSPPV